MKTMPELPEVETIKQGLSRLLIGKQVQKVWSDWPKSFPNSQIQVNEFLIGASIVKVARRAKVLLIELSTKYSLVIHLKMTGQLVYVGKARKLAGSLKSTADLRFGGGHPSKDLLGDLPNKSTRVSFEFSDGSKLFFNDQRKFGWVRLTPTAEVPNIDFFKKVGPEPLKPSFTPKEFTERIKHRANSSIKAALLDQAVIAGIGNIYADESLWAARIHPSTITSKISTQKMTILFTEMRKVLALAIKKGGSTDKNYIDAEGNEGTYLKFAKVFRRQGQACPRCNNLIIKTKVAGRGTHICLKCQRLIK